MYITNVIEYLERTALQYPEKIAFSDGAVRLSFSALLERVDKIGSALIRRGFFREPVAIFMKKSPSAIAAMLGVVRSGCFYSVIDGDLPCDGIRKICDRLGARVVICDELPIDGAAFSGMERVLYGDLVTDVVDTEMLEAIRPKILDCDPVYVVFTSGSTGEPKGVVASHRCVIDYTEALCEAIDFSSESVFGNLSPLCYDAPLKEIMPAIKLGGTVLLLPQRLFLSPVLLCETVERYGINTVCWVSSVLNAIYSLGLLDKYAPRTLRLICFGSEVLPRRAFDAWRAAYPEATFVNLYGPTEATGMSCYWIADRVLDASEPIPIGRPFRNTDILLLDAKGKQVKEGESGEIYIRGGGITLGYYGDAARSENAFVCDPISDKYRGTVFRTGDIGRYNSHGELVFVSRADRAVKRMGHRVDPVEVESAVLSLDGIELAYACFGEKNSVLFYTGSAVEGGVYSYLRDNIPRYMIPSRIERIADMPRLSNGKIDRKYLDQIAMKGGRYGEN